MYRPRLPVTARYATYEKAARRSPRTIELHARWLDRAFTHCDPYTCSTDDLVGWMARHDWSAATTRSVVHTLRAFFRWMCKFGHRGDNPALLLPVPRMPRPDPRPVPANRVEALLAGSSGEVRVMAGLAALCGLRVSEIAQVHSLDLDGGWLHITGKGGHARRVPVPAGWLRHAIAGADGYLFPGRWGEHCCTDHVARTLSRALGDGFSAHQLRHHYATQAYRRSGDLLAVQLLLGHASPVTTQAYVWVEEDRLLRAAGA